MLKKLNEATEVLNAATNDFINTVEETVKSLCENYNVDHINLEDVTNCPPGFTDEDGNAYVIMSIRVEPETDCLQITQFFEEDWDAALRNEGYIWSDVYDCDLICPGDITRVLDEWVLVQEN